MVSATAMRTTCRPQTQRFKFAETINTSLTTGVDNNMIVSGIWSFISYHSALKEVQREISIGVHDIKVSNHTTTKWLL